MTDCKHECCGAAEKVWLPYELEGRSSGLKPHSYCILCGLVENMSSKSKSKSKSKKAKRKGYYMNILARLGITKVQIRLIAKELKRIPDFDNVNPMTRSEQEELFIRAVKKYSKVPEDTIRAFL